MDDILREFLVESHEHLDAMEADLVTLEKSPTDEESLTRVFRAAHTIKGTCGFFDLPRLEQLAHAGENVLTLLLGGDLRFSRAVATALLRFVDAVRGILDAIERTGKEGEPDVERLVADLERLATEGPHASPDAAGASGGEEAAEATAAGARGVAAQTVRLDVGLLNDLMDLVGELVLARNQILAFSGLKKDTAFSLASQQLNRITSDLQDSVMQARMEPVGRVWGRFPRVVRDLGSVFKKRVRIEMRGGATELDRTILEAIGDPLTHLVRNSLDHGIERPDARSKAGKAEEGKLTLSAYQEGGHVVVEVKDDGRGIDPRAIRRHALDKGLRTREELDRLSNADVLQLIFEPGFSTADEVTNVSGRGVGMNVVKINVESVGGTVDVESTPGAGTTFRILLPLTLAIIPGVVVGAGGMRFVVPQAYLRELVLLQEREVKVRVAKVQDAPVCHLRGRLLPLVYLDEELRLRERGAPRQGKRNIAVLELEDRRFGLVVDRIDDTQETVVKPLGRPLDRVPTFSGATILGDGAIALILDVPAIAARAGLLGEAPTLVEPPEEAPQTPKKQTRPFLLFQGPDDGRALLALDLVERLEEFPRESLERAGGREVVQYRERILPLLRIAEQLTERRGEKRHPDVTDTEEERGAVQVAVYSRGERSVGLVVERILDIVEVVPDSLQQPGSRAGVKGTMLVEGRVAECLDVDYLVKLADPRFFEDQGTETNA